MSFYSLNGSSALNHGDFIESFENVNFDEVKDCKKEKNVDNKFGLSKLDSIFNKNKKSLKDDDYIKNLEKNIINNKTSKPLDNKQLDQIMEKLNTYAYEIIGDIKNLTPELIDIVQVLQTTTPEEKNELLLKIFSNPIVLINKNSLTSTTNPTGKTSKRVNTVLLKINKYMEEIFVNIKHLLPTLLEFLNTVNHLNPKDKVILIKKVYEHLNHPDNNINNIFANSSTKNYQNMPSYNVEPSNNEAFSTANYQNIDEFNGDAQHNMNMPNGQPMNMPNGQPMNMPNGQHMNMSNGQPMNMSNGQPMNMPNGQHMDMPNSKQYEKNNIYVDLSCFMNNMKKLENHTNNSLIDMSLLTSNLKSCSYVKKTKIAENDSGSLVDKLSKNLEVPNQGSVSLTSMPATVLVAGDNSVVGLKETFDVSKHSLDHLWYPVLTVVFFLVLIFGPVYYMSVYSRPKDK